MSKDSSRQFGFFHGLFATYIVNFSFKKNLNNFRLLLTWLPGFRRKYRERYEFLVERVVPVRFSQFTGLDVNEISKLIDLDRYEEIQEKLTNAYLANSEIWENLQDYASGKGTYLESTSDLSALVSAVSDNPYDFFDRFGSLILLRVARDYARREGEELSKALDHLGLVPITHETVRKESLQGIYLTGTIVPTFIVIPYPNMFMFGTNVWFFSGWKKRFTHPFAEFLTGNPISSEVNAVLLEMKRALCRMDFKALVKIEPSRVFIRRKPLYLVAPKYKLHVSSPIKWLARPLKHHVIGGYGPFPLAPSAARIQQDELPYFVANTRSNDPFGDYPFVSNTVTAIGLLGLVLVIWYLWCVA